MLPMLLPSGVSVDNTTLEECQKREATWGRPPNDPFTGVPFTSTSQPLPNPQLKLRIDHFILQRGGVRRDGMLGRQGEGKNPQASRLIASREDGQSHIAPFLSKSSMNRTVRSSKSTNQEEDAGLGQSSDYGNCKTYSQPLATENKSELDQKKKRYLNYGRDSVEEFDEKKLQPQTKRPRHDALSGECEILKLYILYSFLCFNFFVWMFAPPPPPRLQSPPAAPMSSVCPPAWTRPSSPPCRDDRPSPLTCPSKVKHWTPRGRASVQTFPTSAKVGLVMTDSETRYGLWIKWLPWWLFRAVTFLIV